MNAYARRGPLKTRPMPRGKSMLTPDQGPLPGGRPGARPVCRLEHAGRSGRIARPPPAALFPVPYALFPILCPVPYPGSAVRFMADWPDDEVAAFVTAARTGAYEPLT